LEARLAGTDEVFLRVAFFTLDVPFREGLAMLFSPAASLIALCAGLVFFGTASMIEEVIGYCGASDSQVEFSSGLAQASVSLSFVGMRHFVFRWAITTVAVMVASAVLHGIRYDTVPALIAAALLLGILNAFVRPVLLILSAPLILLTLGFFILIVNGVMLLIVPGIVTGFHVDSFGSAFWGAIIISIVSWLLSAFFHGSDGRIHVLTHHTQIRRVRGRVIEPGEDRPD
jgi:putative membrane protein